MRLVNEVNDGGPSQSGTYRHWNTLLRLDPPGDLTHEEWWLVIKLARTASARSLPLASTGGEPFSYVLTDEVLRYLRFIDHHCGGEISISDPILGDETRKRRVLVSSTIEEATRSSQLEGATTTRAKAKEMIRTGRQPRDRSELMIMNNYRAMEYVRQIKSEPLTPQIVTDLHTIITEGTLDNPEDAGRIQTPDDERIAVWHEPDNIVVHAPPDAEELRERMEAMCAFANAEPDSVPYVPPVIRAIVLHFWLAYDHPFVDGNGRTARALFYWSMARSGYWLMEYMSISKILREGPTRYAKSFLYTETDSCDATYFILNELAVIQRSFYELKDYLQRKMGEIQDSERSLNSDGRFNGRQVALLRHALRNPGTEYTVRSHQRSHRVAPQSARNDLNRLVEANLLTMKAGERSRFVYRAVDDLADRLAISNG